MQSDIPVFLPGGLSVDDRGSLAFCNDFNFSGVKRFYLVSCHQPNQVRAWHAHRHERKYVTAVSGTALVCAVPIDDWHTPSKSVVVFRHVLSANQPRVLAIPPGYANGWMSLTHGCKLLWFSTAALNESKDDDYRFPARYWDPWKVEER
jgi:dTDP-4-dehydrorhamnose 3,5-epimerase-like enzyme